MQALLVTTDRNTRQQIEKFFAGRQIAVTTCEHPALALEKVETFFNFVFLDLVGEVDLNLEICRAVRDRHGTKPYIFALPTAEKPEAMRSALEAGVDDYLLKPVHSSALQLRLAIGQRRLASQRHIERGEKRFRTLVETMNEGLFEVNEAGVIEFANSRLSKITGYTLDELIGQSADDLLVDPMVRERLPGQTLLGSGTGSEEYSIPLKTKTSEPVWVNLVAAPLPSKEIGQEGSVGLVADITEVRNAEEELRYREQYFRVLLENSSDLITIVDLDGRILYQSLSSDTLLGWPAEELVGSDVYTYLHPEDRQQLEDGLSAALGDGEDNASVQLRLKHQSEQWRHVESVFNNLVDNPVVGGVVITSRDVTERRMAEMALERERALFQQLFRNSPAGIVILDPEDRIVDVNKAFVELFQFEVDALKGKPLAEFIVPQDQLEAAEELSQQISAQQNVEVETVRLRQDGSEVDISILGYPIGVADNHIGSFAIYSDISERKSAERQLFHDASHDALTGLPNRSLFMKRLKLDLRRSKRRDDYLFAVLFIDLDGFKGVNDTLGHAAGDDMLIEVAHRLQACLRPGDTTARLGGDEFTLILEDIREALDAVRVAERVLVALSRPFVLSGQEETISGSIGITYSSSGYDNVEDLMHDADTAMYRAKSRGKACYEIFDSEMQKNETQRRELEEDLAQAIREGQLELHFQPVVGLANRRLLGFEALIRWRHPEHGLLRPKKLIPLCEATGLIVPLGRWVLRHACLQIAEWEKRFPEIDGTGISINLSPQELIHPEFLEHLDQVLAETSIHPGQLGLEIREQQLIGISTSLGDLLWHLNKRGVRLIVDHFGVGDSSLRSLQRYPFEALKVDALLVEEMPEGSDTHEVVRAAISLGESLGLQVVAEGIESKEQLQRLEKLDLPCAQGFLFSAPLVAEEATELIAEPPPW